MFARLTQRIHSIRRVGEGFAQPTCEANGWVAQSLHPPYKTVWLAIVLLISALGAEVRAALTLPSLFSGHMVLQRNEAVPIWGTADAGAEVSVAFAGQTKTTKAGADGKWMVKLDPMEASAKGRNLTVSSGDIVLKSPDVLVGEVWIGSGQSNMGFSMRSQKGIADYKKEANFSTFRFYNASERPTDKENKPTRSEWKICTPETVESCSAVLYFFARELQSNLDGVPIGIINASVGGTSILLWIDRGVQMADPKLAEAVEQDEQNHAKFDVETAMKGYYASARYKNWQAIAAKAKEEGKPVPARPYTPEDTHKNWLPAGAGSKQKFNR